MSSSGPEIRYVTTEDGVSLAFWERGAGQPLVLIHNFSFSHAELEWRVPSLASFYEKLAQSYRLIRFDPRGIGLSTDPPGGWGTADELGVQVGMSTTDMARDIEAVAGALGLGPFALLAVSAQAPVGLEYAATHPDMVSELILWNGMAKIKGSHLDADVRAGQAIRSVGLDPAVRPRFAIPEAAPEEEKETAALVDAAIDRYFGQSAAVQSAWDVEHLLDRVTSRTLVACSPDFLPNKEQVVAASRHLAAGLPDARLRVLGKTSLGPYWATPGIVDELLRFTEAGTGQPAGFRTVVFTDVVGSTEFTNRVGDEQARRATRRLEQRIADLASRHRGRVVKHLGDGSLVTFRSNADSLRFALDVQSEGDPSGLQLRVGMAAGEPLLEDGDVHGSVVAAASRVSQVADPGEIAAAESVYHLATGKGFRFDRKGDFAVKGFTDSMTVWRVLGAEH